MLSSLLDFNLGKLDFWFRAVTGTKAFDGHGVKLMEAGCCTGNKWGCSDIRGLAPYQPQGELRQGNKWGCPDFRCKPATCIDCLPFEPGFNGFLILPKPLVIVPLLILTPRLHYSPVVPL